MSEAHEAEAVEVVADVTPPDTAQDAAEPQLSAEDRALAMGWTPQGQFRGDPSKWVDAETFIKRGEEFLPFLKANNRRLEQALDRANAKIEEMDRGLKSAIQGLSKADQRAYARAKADLEAELDRATEAADIDAVRAINKDIVELERETTGRAGASDTETLPEMAAWMAENPWYGKDRALTGAAQAIAQEAFDEGYVGKAQIAEVSRRLKEAFPERFGKPANPNRQLASTVEGAGAPPRPRGKSYADLPADAKDMCDQLCRDIKGMTRERYAKEYFGQ